MRWEELSTNLDSEEVETLLRCLTSLIDAGFSASESALVQRTMKSLSIGEETELEFPISFSGRGGFLRIKVFVDDLDSVDLYLFTHPELIREIQTRMPEHFADM